MKPPHYLANLMKTKLIEIAFHVYGFCLIVVLLAFLFGVGITAR